MKAYLDAVRHFSLAGRLERKSFWIFFIIEFVLVLVARQLDELVLGTDPSAVGWRGVHFLGLAIFLIHLPAALSVTVRRLHDFDAGGWWAPFAIVPFCFIVIGAAAPTPGKNRFGPGSTRGLADCGRLENVLDDLEAVLSAKRQSVISEAEFLAAKQHILAA